jgi:hypothetical protein
VKIKDFGVKSIASSLILRVFKAIEIQSIELPDPSILYNLNPPGPINYGLHV